jgi:hypothetical protein
VKVPIPSISGASSVRVRAEVLRNGIFAYRASDQTKSGFADKTSGTRFIQGELGRFSFGIIWLSVLFGITRAFVIFLRVK